MVSSFAASMSFAFHEHTASSEELWPIGELRGSEGNKPTKVESTSYETED